MPFYEVEAKKRQESGANQYTSLKEKIPEASIGQSKDQAAKDFVNQKIDGQKYTQASQKAAEDFNTSRSHRNYAILSSLEDLRKWTQSWT